MINKGLVLCERDTYMAKSNLKKMLSMVMILLICLSMMPASVWAEKETEESEGENISIATEETVTEEAVAEEAEESNSLEVEKSEPAPAPEESASEETKKDDSSEADQVVEPEATNTDLVDEATEDEKELDPPAEDAKPDETTEGSEIEALAENSDSEVVAEEASEKSDKVAEESKKETEKATKGDETEKEAEKQPEKEAVLPAFSSEKTVDGIKVSVKAAEGVFPEEATLSVKKISRNEQKRVDRALGSVRDGEANVAASYTFDVKVLDKDGEEVQPKDNAKVKISFKLAEADSDNLDTQVYHISEKSFTPEAVEALKVKTTGETVMVETHGFSYYTVEFTYNNLEYVLAGGESIALSEVLDAVGLIGEVSTASVSDESLFTVEMENGAWVIKSHKPFSTTEWMKVTIDGIEYKIVVTDAIPGTNVTTEVEMTNGESKEGNFTIGNGGVIFGPYSGTATIENGTVTNNAVNSRRGGYSTTKGSAFIARGNNSLQFNKVTINSGANNLVFNIWDNCSITAEDTTLSGSTNSSNDVPFLMIGGYPNGSNGTLNFKGTSAISNAKGSIIGGNGGSVINVNSGTLTLTGSEITLKKGNHFVVKSGATLILDGTTLAAADSSDKPAITVEDGGKLILNNVTLEANNNITIQSGGEASLKGTITPKGKQQILVYGTLNLQDTTADLSGNGAIRWIRIEDGGTVNITNSKLSDSTRLGVIRANAGSTLNIDNSAFENNKANGSAEQVNGGVILAWDSAITIKDSTFAENSAASGGGVIWMSGGTLDVSGSTFTDNRANGHGGVIYQSGGAVTVTSSKFDGNIADDGWYAHGGAICTMGDKATLTVDDGTFTNNKSLLGSAIIILNGATGHINSALFEGNEIEKSGAYVNDGGTVFVSDGSRLVMPSVSIHNNTAAKGGSGLYVCGVGTANIMAGAAAIYDNANGDVMQRHYPGSKTRIFDEALGGGQHNWTWTESGDGNNVLYAASNLNSSSSGGGDDAGGRTAAGASGGAEADVVIKNNTSVGFGAGLGANGTVEIGDRTQIRVYKVWNDNSDAAGRRLIDDDFVAQLTVKDKDGEKVDLSADGIEVKVHKSGEFDAFTEVVAAAKAGRTEKVTASKDNWVIDITGLPEEGWPYTVYESASGKPGEAVSEYYLKPDPTDPGTYIDLGFTGFKNTYAEGKATIEATKTLTGKDLEKDEFEFVLLDKDGEEIAKTTNDAKGKLGFELNYTLADLELTTPEEGAEPKPTTKTFEYTVKEVDGGEKGVTYDSNEYAVSAKVTYTPGNPELAVEVKYEGGKPEFKNEFKEEELTSVSVTKVWDDLNNLDGHRHEEVVFNLFANGEQVDSLTLTASDAGDDENEWKGEFKDLPVRDDAGEEITYTVEEVPVKWYIIQTTGTAKTGFKIVNINRPWIPEVPGTPGEEEHGMFTLKKTVSGLAEKDKTYAVEVLLMLPDGTSKTLEYELTPNETITFDYVIAGTKVKITEKVTGYKVTYKVDGKEAQEFTIADGDSKQVVINNDKTPGDKTQKEKAPKTADESNVALWLAIMAAAVFATGLSIRSKKQ